MQNIKPKDAARQLGVAAITVYGWVKSGKIGSVNIPVGMANRIFIPESEIDRMKAEIESSREAFNLTAANDLDAAKWVSKYHSLIGKVPPMYGAYRIGKVSFEVMKAEAIRIFGLLS